MRKLPVLLLAILMFLSTVFTGCTTEKEPEVSYWDVYKSTFSGGLTTLNPFTLSGTSQYTYIANIIEGLVETDIYGRFVPALAESWDTNEDTSVWTFHLREGEYWVDHNGEKTEWEVTA
ncbi:MAG TPA: hypothetical protein GX529_08840 [Firmicutes bacterium]|nr:hypothetical protein [Candidatus Fermentithermobacillaceae bacterium]